MDTVQNKLCFLHPFLGEGVFCFVKFLPTNRKEKEEMKNKKKLWIGVAVVAVLALALGSIYAFFGPKGTAGSKTIVVSVVDTAGKSEDFTLHTDEEYLRGALEEAKLIEGTESNYGLFVTTVNGTKADDTKQEWWCFTKGGEMLETGVDTTPIADGDQFEATLTVGY